MASQRISRLLAFGIIFVMVAALLPALPRAEAQGGMMVYGDVVSGSITADNYFEVWAFDGQKGDRVEIVMEGDGNLDPYLGLIDYNTEEVIIEDDDSAGNSNALIEITLPATSTYLIVATRYNFDIGTTQGQYALSLSGGDGPTQVSNPASEEPVTTAEPVEIEEGIWYIGDLVLGEPAANMISDDAYAQFYGVELEAGTELVIGMLADGSNLDSYLFFADEELNLLAEDDDSGADVGLGATDAFISLTVNDGGYYYIVATRAGMDVGSSSGNYVLIAGVPEDEGPAPQQEDDDGLPDGVDMIAEVEVGATYEAEITDASFMHLYILEGQAGDEVTITMSSSDGLDSYLGLLDPAGEVIAEDDDSGGGVDALITYTLPESGTYLIAATRAGIDQGSTTGAYVLDISSGEVAAEAGAGLSGFGGLPGRAIESDGGTFYLRGNGASSDPAKSPPVEAFMGLDSQLPGARNPFNPVRFGISLNFEEIK